MIKYTNKHDLHPILAKMLTHNDYDYSDDPTIISATSIMKPTRMVALERYYSGSDKEIEVFNLIPSVFGSAMHSLFEVSLNENKEIFKDFGVDPDELEILQENRSVKEIGKWKVSGKYDLLYKYKNSKWRLGDLKTLSVWGVMIDPKKKEEEWIKQLSIYRWLNQDKDIDNIAEIFMIFTDYSQQEARRNSQYPQGRLQVKEINLMSIKDTEIYIKSKLYALEIALKELEETGDCFTKCSQEDLWMDKDKYKYYKPNKSGTINYRRATKVCDTLEEAQQQLAIYGGDIVKYPAKAKRCNYCSMVEVCSQYKELENQGLIN